MSSSLILTCDRCHLVCEHLDVVGPYELCSECTEALDEFVATSPVQRRHGALSDQALSFAAAHGGRVTDDQIAALNGESPRTSYYRLTGLVRRGLLVRVGRGEFALPPTGQSP